MNEITTVGADLAKDVIVVCAGDAQGRPVYFKQLSFAGFAEWAAKLSACTFGMEACSTAHHWARLLSAHGHTPKLMAAEFVTPFRKSQSAKNDRNDAQAILAAVRQPDMRFVSVKSVDQQAMLAWHRARAGFGEERKALLNRTRGLLAEFGVWLGRSAAVLIRQLPQLAQDQRLPEHFRPILSYALEHLRRIDRGLLTQGARSTLQIALKREPLRRSRLEQWIVALHGRVGYHKTLVAIANKHTRILWAILAHGESYDPDAWRRHAPPRHA